MKILICSDGSEQAERAFKLGSQIAAGVGAETTLLGILEEASDSTALLDSLKRGLTALTEKKVKAELITATGDPIQEIVRRTRETGYDLVVIGAVEKAAHGHFRMSSKSYRIVKEIRPPVLIVSGKLGGLKRLLICSGGKAFFEPAVRLTGAIARGVGASATLFHVIPETPAIYSGLARMEPKVEDLLRSNSELGRNLRQEKELLEQMEVATEVRLRRGAVLEQILAEIEQGDYDLITTGSALTHNFRSYVLGDISREIVNRIHCAVLVVRTQASEERRRARLWKWWDKGQRAAVAGE